MAQYVKIPKDLDDIKDKFLLGLTKRQCVCFAPGFVVGLIVFFITKKYGLDTEFSIISMGIAVSPFFVAGIYKNNGLTFEKLLKYIIMFFKKPKKRVYISENIYSKIEKQIEIDRLTKQLAGGNTSYEKKENRKNSTDKKRKKTN